MFNRVRWLWFAVAIPLVAILAVLLFGSLLHLLAFAMLLATGLHPVVRFLERRGFPHGLAVPLTFVGLLVVLAGMLLIVIPPLVEQATELVTALPGYVGNLSRWSNHWDAIQARLPFLPSVVEVTEWLTAHAGAYLQKVLSWSGQVAGLLASAASVALILYYMLSDGRLLKSQFMRLVPPYRREEANALLSLLADRVGRFTLGTLTDMAIVGLLTGVGLWLLGVPNPLMLGVIVGAFNILPYVGAILGAIPALIIAFSISIQTGLLALLVIVVVQQLEGYVIYPKVVGNAVGLHPLYVLIALTAGMQLWGVAGVFLGIPAAVVIKTLLEAWVAPRIERMAPPSQAKVQLATTPLELPRLVLTPTPPEPAGAPEGRPKPPPPAPGPS